MSHARQQIRDALVTAVTGLTTTGATVSNSPFYDETVAPGVAVFTLQETIESDEETNGQKIIRFLEVAVEAWSKKVSGVMDELDTICAEVETVLAGDVTLGGKVRYLELLETSIETSKDSDQPVARARMVWRASYTTIADAPTAPL